MKIPAKLITQGVGFAHRQRWSCEHPPSGWSGTAVDIEDFLCWFAPPVGTSKDFLRSERFAEMLIDLADHQTAFGCLRRLAMWGVPSTPRPVAAGVALNRDLLRDWSLALTLDVWNEHHAVALAAILTTIGMDHAIRREFGWKV